MDISDVSESDKEGCIGRAFFSQSGTHIGFSALIELSENGKSMHFENVRFRSDDPCWSQTESFFRALLEIRCFMALEKYLEKSQTEQLVEIGKKLSSAYMSHGPWHFWEHLEVRDLDYLKRHIQLLDAEEV